MAGSEAAKVTALDWVVVAAGVLAYASAFLPWYTLTASVPMLGITQSTNVNAWRAGFGAWFSVLCSWRRRAWCWRARWAGGCAGPLRDH